LTNRTGLRAIPRDVQGVEWGSFRSISAKKKKKKSKKCENVTFGGVVNPLRISISAEVLKLNPSKNKDSIYVYSVLIFLTKQRCRCLVHGKGKGKVTPLQAQLCSRGG